MFNDLLYDKNNLRVLKDPLVCEKKELENCLVQKNNKICSECKLGSYLKEGKCFLNSPEVITNCEEYKSETSCSSCKSGYFMKTP